jgi:hypothetical protein
MGRVRPKATKASRADQVQVPLGQAPLQQSLGTVQAAPVVPQQVGVIAVVLQTYRSPQHSVPALQVAPRLVQHRLPAQSPLQQSWTLTQEAPLAAQEHVLLVLPHTPLQHDSPLSVQPAPIALQARHWWLMHSPLQHSASRLQLAAPARHVHTLPMQSPWQQSLSAPQLLCSAAQLQVDDTWSCVTMGQVPKRQSASLAHSPPTGLF